MTYLAIPIAAANVEQGREQIERASAGGADIVEIRADYLDDVNTAAVRELVGFAKQLKLKTIVTARDKQQGGAKGIEQDVRLNILADIAAGGADFIDCEFINYVHTNIQERIDSAIKGSKCRLIISHHDFAKPFTDIEKLYAEIIGLNAEAIAKLIYTAKHVNDCFAAMDLLANKESDVITFAMGQAGLISRVLAKKLGGFLTFASLDEATATAPGQITISQLKNIYRWDSINEQTSIYGVIGNPVAQSKSPLIHNALLAAAGVNSIYLPMLVEGDWLEFKIFADSCIEREKLGAKGFSVTVPHKENAIEYAHQRGGFVEPLAIQIGAANTLHLAMGQACAYNTDYMGAMDAIVMGLNGDKGKLHAMPAAVIGAGGAARAVIAALSHAGAKVTIYNRTFEKSRHLAKVFSCEYQPIEKIAEISKAKLIVNCTSLGMYPEIDSTPVRAEFLNSDMLVFDTVYNPVETKLLKEAKAAGARTVSGLEMFIAQAAEQFKIFTGQTADPQIIRNILTSVF